MTSYDTEVPAMQMLITESCGLITDDLAKLLVALADRARKHRGQLMAGRTHGQHAQPITFGIKCLNWFDALERSAKRFRDAIVDNRVMKLSGAVGTYGTLGPEVEEAVGKILLLNPVIASQILSLDRLVNLMCQMAIIAGVGEKIAKDLWLMSQTEVGEIREPFGKMQKGSSAMMHKKNPVLDENVMGCARVVRSCAKMLMDEIPTTHERDISHSSVERFGVPDAFGTLDHLLQRLTNIITKMEVFPERMEQNLGLTYGCMASQKVEMLLKKYGMSAEVAYRTVQAACSKAMENRRRLYEVLIENETVRSLITTAGKSRELHDCFDWKMWVAHEDYIYKRAGL